MAAKKAPKTIALRDLEPKKDDVKGGAAWGSRRLQYVNGMPIGCFVAGTPIRLATGESVEVERIEPGRSVVSRQDGRPAREIRPGDALLLFSGEGPREFAAIVRIERRPYGGDVFNFVVEGGDDLEGHLIVAGGIVTGDLLIQERITPPDPRDRRAAAVGRPREPVLAAPAKGSS